MCIEFIEFFHNEINRDQMKKGQSYVIEFSLVTYKMNRIDDGENKIKKWKKRRRIFLISSCFKERILFLQY